MRSSEFRFASAAFAISNLESLDEGSEPVCGGERSSTLCDSRAVSVVFVPIELEFVAVSTSFLPDSPSKSRRRGHRTQVFSSAPGRARQAVAA